VSLLRGPSALLCPKIAFSQDLMTFVIMLDGSLDWRGMQTLARSMPSLHKTLILVCPRKVDKEYTIDEIAVATEHAPFRHRKVNAEVGAQVKKRKTFKDVCEDRME
jgi:hypothetical protein